MCCCVRVVVKESGGINALDFAALRFSIAALAFVPFLPGALRADENGEVPHHTQIGTTSRSALARPLAIPLRGAVALDTLPHAAARLRGTLDRLAVGVGCCQVSA